MNKLIIIGASGHGKVIADIAKLNGYTDICFLDDDTSKKECDGYPVIGDASSIQKNTVCDYIVAIGNPANRKKIQTVLMNFKVNIVSLIHPNAVVSENTVIGAGTVIMAGAVINTNVKIGDACIINTCASVDHDCVIGDYVHVSVGAHIAGTVEVQEKTWIGIGAVVSNNLFIIRNCMIGAGAVVVKDIKKKGTYVGVPATAI